MNSPSDVAGCDIVYRALNTSSFSNNLAVPEGCAELVSHDLIDVIRDQQGQIKALTAKINSLELKLEAHGKSQTELSSHMEQSYSDRFDDLKTLQISHQEHIDEMFNVQLSSMDTWLMILGIGIAIAGAITFTFVTQYRKREVDKIVDNTIKEVRQNLENKNIVKGMVVNVFSTPEVKDKIDEIESSIWKGVEPLVKTTIEDYLSSVNGDGNGRAEILESITKKDKGGADE